MARTLAFVLAVGLALAAPLRADPGELRVGTSGDYAPFSLSGRGFDVEVAGALAKDLGLRVEWVRFRWPELGSMIGDGRFDVAMSGITWHPERAVVGWMTRAVAQGGPCVVGDAEAPPIAVNRGGVLEAWARRRFAAESVFAVDDNRSMPLLLAGGAVGAFVTDSFELAGWRERLRAPVVCEPPRDRKVYWVAPARAGELGTRIDRWLAVNETRLETLRARWLGTRAPRDDLDDLIDQLARRLAFMPYVAAWKRAHSAPVTDPARERIVLADVEGAARAHGLDAASVRQFFALQIDLAKAVERRAAIVPATLDLEREIRPALLRIGERIVERLAALAPVNPSHLGDGRLVPLGELLAPEEIAKLREALARVRKASS
jgi:cyclohexadienyl dehydratase